MFLVERVYRIAGEEHSVYSYKERTNVGLFASAATANGWVALVECRSDKYASKNSKDVYLGRSDLRIWRDNRHHEIEAKFLRVMESSSKTRLNIVTEKAIQDATRAVATGAKFDRKIAMTFVVPTIPSSEQKTLDTKAIGEYKTALLKYIKSTKPHFIAYTFPGQARAVGSPKKRIALGVILFGTEPPKA